MRPTLGVVLLAALSATPVWGGGKDGGPVLPGRVMRHDQDETAVIRGRSPRADGLSYAYARMKTPLRGNLIVSDVLLPTDAWHTWDGRSVPRFDTRRQTPENYHESHNHYQNVLSEVINATAGANSIPLWGESVAAVGGANVWGGFFSARSRCEKDDLLGRYLPPDLERGCGRDFDAQLTGLEVDVLNAGKPGVYPNKAKHGVQIVGFGNPNGQALSVIAENFNREPPFRRGQFESILYAQNSLHPDYGRFIVMDFDRASIGLDMRRPLFTGGAMDFHSAGVGTGLLLDSGRSGELYGGRRWPGQAPDHGWLTARLGTGGLRVVSHDDTREWVAIDNNGGIYLNGDVYLNGARLIAGSPPASAAGVSRRPLILGALAASLLLLGVNVVLTRYLVRRALRRHGAGLEA